MSLAQENFERAVTSANRTIGLVYGVHPSAIKLKEKPTHELEAMAWDLNAIASALQMEINNRRTQDPVDLG